MAGVFRDHLHFPDPSALYTLMGCVAANMIQGTPVWLMFVGPPSCGKSELLNSLLDVPGMVEAADIGSEAAFLSGSSARDKAHDATGGLLCQAGKHGGLILNDFTSILSKPQDKINLILAVFRECFGGRWTRHVGGDGGRAIQWVGKLALYAGVTGRIDQHHQMSAELGERWIYYRFDDHEVWAEVMMALSNNRDDWRGKLREAVARFFHDLGFEYGIVIPRREFTNAERVRIYNLAAVAARCRSGVSRDHYTKEINGARESELATRLSTVLGQLLVGMDAIGVSPTVRWRLITKVAMDSMPKLRKLVIEAVAEKDHSVLELAKILRCSKSVTARVVEDLEVHEVVETLQDRVHLSYWMNVHYRKFS